jgi:hypothetical protein
MCAIFKKKTKLQNTKKNNLEHGKKYIQTNTTKKFVSLLFLYLSPFSFLVTFLCSQKKNEIFSQTTI